MAGLRHGPFPVGVEITVADPRRASLLYSGPGGMGWGFDDAIPLEPGDPILVNSGGEPTEYDAERWRVTPDQARQAVREFVTTGHRPTCLTWDCAPD